MNLLQRLFVNILYMQRIFLNTSAHIFVAEAIANQNMFEAWNQRVDMSQHPTCHNRTKSEAETIWPTSGKTDARPDRAIYWQGGRF